MRGPDVPISIDAAGLAELIPGSRAIDQARGGTKEVLAEEQPTIAFANVSVVAMWDIDATKRLPPDNSGVKRPGTGEIRAAHFDDLLGRTAKGPIAKDTQLKWSDVSGWASRH